MKRYFVFFSFIFLAFAFSVSNVYSTAIFNMSISILISIMFVALLFQFSHLLQSSKLVASAKTELYELGVSIIIFVFFVSWFSSQGILRDFGLNLLDQSRHFTDEVLANLVQRNVLMKLLNFIILTIYNGDITIGPANMDFLISFQIGPGLKPLITVTSFSEQLLDLVMAEMIGLKFLFNFIELWLIPYLMPIGIFLRTISFTRDVGNVLISLSFGFFIVYPFMYFLDYKIWLALKDSGYLRVKYGVLSDLSSALGSFFNLFTKPANISLLFISLLIFRLPAMVFILLSTLVFFAFKTAYTTLYIAVVFGAFLAFLNIFVTISLTREIAKGLGTNVVLSALEKVI